MDQPFSSTRAHARQRIARLLPLLLLAPGVSSCGLLKPPAARLTPPMPVQAPLRKQVLQGYMPFGSIGWVNNEQVVFSGKQINHKQKDALYLWDQKSQPRLLLSNSPGGCISEGTIWAAQLLETGKTRYFRLESPTFSLRPAERSQAPPKSQFEPVSCTFIPTPQRLEQRTWKALRKGDGFLDFGPHGRPTGIHGVSHLTTDQNTRRNTDIRMEIPRLPVAVYAPHDDSYLIFDLNISQHALEQWRSTGRLRIWKLDSHLHSTPIDTPYGEWSNQDISFRQVRPGLLIISNNFTRKREAGGAGLYLFTANKTAQRLERGLAEDAAISPDGCRVAYSFRPRLITSMPEGGPRLVVLNVCGPNETTQR